MVQVIKSEWHSLERRYGIEIDEAVLSEIYPDLEEDQITSLLQSLENGEADIVDIINDAWDEGVEFDWEWLDEDDLWTDRKGGYDVTYSLE